MHVCRGTTPTYEWLQSISHALRCLCEDQGAFRVGCLHSLVITKTPSHLEGCGVLHPPHRDSGDIVWSPGVFAHLSGVRRRPMRGVSEEGWALTPHDSLHSRRPLQITWTASLDVSEGTHHQPQGVGLRVDTCSPPHRRVFYLCPSVGGEDIPCPVEPLLRCGLCSDCLIQNYPPLGGTPTEELVRPHSLSSKGEMEGLPSISHPMMGASRSKRDMEHMRGQ